MQMLLVRHPAAALGDGVCYGRLDLPIRDPAEVDALAKRLSHERFARIWTSPAQRCRAVAEALAARSGHPPIVDARLQELDFGAWEGMRWDAVDRAALDRWAASPLDFAPPGGEPGRALLIRVAAFGDTVRRDGIGGVVVSHGGPLRVLPALLRGQTPDLLAPTPPPGSITRVKVGFRPGDLWPGDLWPGDLWPGDL